MKIKETAKRLLAGVMALTMMLTTSVSFTTYGESAYDDYSGGNAAVSSDLDVSGNGSLGNMIADELLEKNDEQQENNGCNVFSVEVEGTTAYVSYETTQDCTLTVGIYDNEGEELLAVGTAQVSAEETDAEVEIVTDNMPEYFYIRAYLVKSDTLRPLCTEYDSPMYTKDMQEFLGKTTEDFDEERVLNFDEDEDTNFAVFSEETVLIHDGATNVVISADEEKQEYVFGNVDEKITSLRKGDIFAHENNGELLIVKVGSITVNGTQATVNGDDVELEEVFEHLRIDGEAPTESAVVDTSDLEDGVTYLGCVEDGNDSEIATYAVDEEGKSGFSLKFEIKDDEKNENDPSNTSFSFSASLTIKIEASAKLYISLFETNIQVKLDYSNKVEVKFEGNSKDTYPLASLRIDVVPGIVAIELTPSFVFEFSGTASLNGTLKGSVGFKASTQTGAQSLTTTPSFTVSGELQVTLFVGLSLEPKLIVVHEKVANASLTAKVGAEVKAVFSSVTTAVQNDTIHDCVKCIDGKVNAKFQVKAKVKLLDADWLSFDINILETTVKLFNFYYSLTFNERGFTECPHIRYLHEIKIHNLNSEPISGAKIIINDNEEVLTTNEDGVAKVYLPLGFYDIEVSANGYVTKKTSIGIVKNISFMRSSIVKLLTPEQDNEAQKLVDQMLDSFGFARDGSSNPEDVDYEKWDSENNPGEDIPEEIEGVKVKQVSLGETHSAAITTDGSLYMWGDNYHGQLGNGTNEDSSVPIKIMDNVAFVSLGYYHSAAITTDGSLYMWGYNYSGQLGNGTTEDCYTPIKIMDNVASVSLGDEHSAVITIDGSLYTCGQNLGGALGNGTIEGSYIPIKIMDDVTTVSLGENYSSAITTDGSLYMWGVNWYGQLGNGTTEDGYIPAKIMDNVTAVSLKYESGAAITTDGSLYMWGQNDYGQLGNGKSGGNYFEYDESIDSYTPIKIMDNVVSVSLGNAHSAAITTDGDLYMWGWNESGMIGNGTTEDSSTPIKIINNVASVSLGYVHSAAITTDGSLYTWGDNYYGQLGNGKCGGNSWYGGFDDGIDSSTPIKITIPPVASAANATSTYSMMKASPSNITQTFTDLIPNEIYNYYSVKSRTVKDVLSAYNLLYIGQAVSDEKGTLTVSVPDGVVFVKAMTEFTVRNADITEATACEESVSLTWNPVDNADEYEVIGITKDGISVQVKTSDTSIEIDGLTPDEDYAFVVTSIIYGEQSVPYVNDFVLVHTDSTEVLIGDVNNDGVVDPLDNIALAMWLAGWEGDINEAAADINGDGAIDPLDNVALAMWLAGW
ncbi:MAG: hypothetical protein J1E39_03200 [Eubacterium sp.]|nr:hypothetical protein [Eubacterium sp.]